MIAAHKLGIGEEFAAGARSRPGSNEMLVDSSGSMKPPARPIATTFLFQIFLRLPVVKRSSRGCAERPAVEIAAASPRLIVADEAAAVDVAVAGAMLQRDAPLPPGRSRRRPRIGRGGPPSRTAPRPRDRRAASASSPRSPRASACSISRPRNPEQSMNRSPLDARAAFEHHRLDEPVRGAQAPLDDRCLRCASRRALPRSRADSAHRDRHRIDRHRRFRRAACRAAHRPARP